MLEVLSAVLCLGALHLGSGLEAAGQEGSFLTIIVLLACIASDLSPLQVNVKVKSAFNNKLFALNVVVNIPVPDNTAKADIQTSQGQLLAALKLASLMLLLLWQRALTAPYHNDVIIKSCVRVTHHAMVTTLPVDHTSPALQHSNLFRTGVALQCSFTRRWSCRQG